MQEQLISYKTAILAKEKDFDWVCRSYFKATSSDVIRETIDSGVSYGILPDNEKVTCYLRPAQSTLQEWLREVHNIETEVYTYISSSIKKVIYRGQIVKHNRKEISKISPLYEESKDTNKLSPPIDFNTYEECLEELLFQALKMI